jgi:hypothetical protein
MSYDAGGASDREEEDRQHLRSAAWESVARAQPWGVCSASFGSPRNSKRRKMVPSHASYESYHVTTSTCMQRQVLKMLLNKGQISDARMRTRIQYKSSCMS